VLIKIIETFNSKEIEEIIRPKKMMTDLLDEIKLRRPSASVKGAIWQLVGLLHSHYDNAVNEFLEESQDVMYINLEEQVRTEKPEIKAIVGLFKGLQASLNVGCTLEQKQLDGLFLMLRTTVTPLEEVHNRAVMKAAMKLMSAHANLFTDQILHHAHDLITLALKLCVMENIEVRDTANEMLGSLIM
jgi:hypothetical protein